MVKMTEFEQDIAERIFESQLAIQEWWDNYINSCTMSEPSNGMEIIDEDLNPRYSDGFGSFDWPC